jgi:hypothetical protein
MTEEQLQQLREQARLEALNAVPEPRKSGWINVAGYIAATDRYKGEVVGYAAALVSERAKSLDATSSVSMDDVRSMCYQKSRELVRDAWKRPEDLADQFARLMFSEIQKALNGRKK